MWIIYRVHDGSSCYLLICTYVDGSGGGTVLTYVCLCLSVLLYYISKIDAARITKLDEEIFHDESWKSIYFGVRRLNVKVTSHNNIAGLGLCTLVSAVFF